MEQNNELDPLKDPGIHLLYRNYSHLELGDEQKEENQPYWDVICRSFVQRFDEGIKVELVAQGAFIDCHDSQVFIDGILAINSIANQYSTPINCKILLENSSELVIFARECGFRINNSSGQEVSNNVYEITFVPTPASSYLELFEKIQTES